MLCGNYILSNRSEWTFYFLSSVQFNFTIGDEIIFYGHSLNKADYSYFESIFDTYDVFHSNVKIKFYYWRGYDKSENINEQEKQLRLKKQARKTMSNIFKLLNSYGSTLANEHGENIINKLMLEQRLEISPSPLI